MSASQNYGVLRIVHMRPPTRTTKRQEKDLVGSLPEERLVHLLTRKETTIGRALSSDFILLDSTVSRVHARLVYDGHGWRIYNVAEQNTLYVNTYAVSSGDNEVVHPLDFLLLGNTVLQLVAPKYHEPATVDENGELIQQVMEFHPPQEWRVEEERLFKFGTTLQSVLFRRSQVRTRRVVVGIGVLILLVSALVILILNNVLGISTLVQGSPLSILAILTIPIIPALGINLLVNFMDRFEREPWFLRLAAFLWGAIIAIPPTFLIEQYVDSLRPIILGPHPDDIAHAIFAGLNAGITEETVKGLGLLLLFIVLRDEFDNVTDGIIYGALIGAGFAMVENFSYFSTHPKSLLVLLIGRVVLGWLSHSTFTACFGAALGYIRHTRVKWQQIVIPLGGYLAAVGLHSVFDFVNFFATALVVNYPTNTNVLTSALIVSVGNYVPSFIAQMVIVYCLVKSLAHEASIIREFLAEEVSSGIVTVDEYALLQHAYLRRKIERHILLQGNWRQWTQIKRLYQVEIKIAFWKWHASMGEKPGNSQAEATYRHRIQQLRQEIIDEESLNREESIGGRRVALRYQHEKGTIEET
ncbi:MAG: PrsW family intramembrane metalloprotease [Ktedonobacteraceae bacterium]|nr:PrsW family intramembrane metalloprotease [Ktedonobacteraceae bacterium]